MLSYLLDSLETIIVFLAGMCLGIYMYDSILCWKLAAIVSALEIGLLLADMVKLYVKHSKEKEF